MANIITTLLTAHGFKKTDGDNLPENEIWELILKDDEKETSIRVGVKGFFGVQNVHIFIRPIMGKYIEKNFINDNLIRSIFNASEWLNEVAKNSRHPTYSAKMVFDAITREMNWAILE